MPTDVRMGPTALDVLQSWEVAGERPVILCGKGAVRRFGQLDTVLNHVPHATVLDGFPENPTFTDCDDFAKALGETGGDLIIGLGGGSVLDGAKALAVLGANGGVCRDHMDAVPTKRPLPVIAVPTTAGTGSEVTPYAVLVDPERNKKSTLKGPGLFPRMALLDPALTRSLPREVTLATGLDALSQAMEGMLSKQSTPTGDALALEVCRGVRRWLPVALEDPDSDEARAQLLHAAMLSGVIIAQSGTTLVHGMGYYFTLEHGIAHGIANALLLPPVFWWNGHLAPEKTARLAEALGGPCEPTPGGASSGITRCLYAFYKELHFTCAADSHGVPEAALKSMAADIVADPYRFKNQIGALNALQVKALYYAAWAGSVEELSGIVKM